jgi:hypothetical protein
MLPVSVLSKLDPRVSLWYERLAIINIMFRQARFCVAPCDIRDQAPQLRGTGPSPVDMLTSWEVFRKRCGF